MSSFLLRHLDLAAEEGGEAWSWTLTSRDEAQGGPCDQ